MQISGILSCSGGCALRRWETELMGTCFCNHDWGSEEEKQLPVDEKWFPFSLLFKIFIFLDSCGGLIYFQIFDPETWTDIQNEEQA